MRRSTAVEGRVEWMLPYHLALERVVALGGARRGALNVCPLRARSDSPPAVRAAESAQIAVRS